MTQRTALAVSIVLLFSALTASADSGRVAIGARAGTLGLGGDLMVNVLPDVNVRLGVGALSGDGDGEWSDVDYDFEADLLTYPITVDWYPFEGSFYVSAGIVINETDVSLDSRISGPLMIGGNIYTAAEIGTLSGDLSFDDVVPYVGIGWGNAFGRSKQWGFMADLGVAFIGAPDVSLSATGTAAANPAFVADLALEKADLEDDVDGMDIYPVLSASLYFRF